MLRCKAQRRVAKNKKIMINKWRMMAFAAVAALAFAGCSEDPEVPEDPTPDPEPEVPEVVLPAGDKWALVGDNANEGGATVLRSAIHTVGDDGSYTFYFSSNAGMTTDTDMLASETLLTVSGVKEPTGEQSTAKVTFKTPAATYTSDGYASKTVDINLLYNSSAKLWVELTDGSGENFRACYNGMCLETDYPELGGNAVAVNREQPVTLGSVVELRNEKTGIWTYYLYEEEGVEKVDADAAIFTLTVPKTLVAGAVGYEEGTAPAFEQDFYKGLVKGTEVIFDAMPANYAHHAHGTLYAGIMDDVAGPYKRDIRMKYTSDDDDVFVRLNWQGTVWATYDSDNTYTLTFNDKDTDYEFDNVFIADDGVATYFMFGTNGAENCEDLKAEGEAEFGVKWVLTNLSNLSEGAYEGELDELAQWNLYNYATLDTHVNGKKNTTVSGSFQYAPCPNAEGEEVYLLFDLLYSTGQRVKGEWYGPLTETTTENADIAPYKPVYYITFTSPEGEELERLEILDVKRKDYKMQGDENYFTLLDTDRFYFVHEQSYSDFTNDFKTPQVAFNPNYIDGQMHEVGLDETVKKGDYTLYFTFNSISNLTYWDHSSSFPEGGWAARMSTVKDGQMKVSKDETTGLWNIYLRIQDYISNSSGYAPYGHSYNYMTIEYQGSVTDL